jgi:hypothetical protein
MNIMRVNCSHGDHELYERVITTVREVVREEDVSRLNELTAASQACAASRSTASRVSLPRLALGCELRTSSAPPSRSRTWTVKVPQRAALTAVSRRRLRGISEHCSAHLAAAPRSWL